MRGTICAGQWKGDVRVTRNGDAQSTSTRGGTANDTEYPTALRHCRGLLPAYSRPRAARARARQCDGACGRAQRCLRTPTGRCSHAAARRGIARAGRAHRTLSKLSADSAAGIVPSSEFELKDLRRARFVPLCSEMLMHRSVPRTHTSTAARWPRGSSSERVLDMGTRGGCCTRSLFVPGRRKVLQPCRSAHTPSTVRVRILGRSLATHTHGHVALRHCEGLLPAYMRPRAARAHARQCDGACGHAQGCLRTPTGRCSHAAARRGIARAGRAHRELSSLSADSAAGMVPSSEFELKDLRRARFVPLCSEMLTAPRRR